MNYVDPTGHWAVTLGVSGILTVVFGLKGEFDFAIDDNGNWGFVTTVQGAEGFGVGAGPSAGLNWKADTIDDLAGPIASVGGSWANLGAELEFCKEDEPDFQLCGVEVGYGSEGYAASGYVAGGGTTVINVPKLARRLLEAIKARFKKNDSEPGDSAEPKNDSQPNHSPAENKSNERQR